MAISNILGYSDIDLSMLVGDGVFLMPEPSSKYWDDFFPQRSMLKKSTKNEPKQPLFKENYISPDEMTQRYRECGLFS